MNQDESYILILWYRDVVVAYCQVHLAEACWLHCTEFSFSFKISNHDKFSKENTDISLFVKFLSKCAITGGKDCVNRHHE